MAIGLCHTCYCKYLKNLPGKMAHQFVANFRKFGKPFGAIVFLEAFGLIYSYFSSFKSSQQAYTKQIFWYTLQVSYEYANTTESNSYA
jgi:amino acid permease